MTMPVDELLVALGLLDRIEVFALDVLDERKLGHRRFVDLADDRRDCMQPRFLCGPPAPLTRDDLEAVPAGPQKDRLKHAALRDRFGELADRLFAKLDARLVRVRPDARYVNLTNARLISCVARWLPGGIPQESRKAHPEPPARLVIAHAASATRGRRAISS